MKAELVFEKLALHREEMRRMGVESLALFGSVARGEANEQSDIDILVRFDRPVGIFQFSRVRRRLSEILGRSVDLVTPDALREEMRSAILEEAVHAA